MRFPFADSFVLVSLKGHEAFDGVFEHGKRFAHRGITGFVRFRGTETETTKSPEIGAEMSKMSTEISLELRQIHFGVTAKKRTKPAVLRNRIKRLLRESLRRTFVQMSAQQRREAFSAIDSIVLICNVIPERAAMIGLEHTSYPVERIIKDALKSQRNQQNQTQQNQILRVQNTPLAPLASLAPP
jgi:ribonuclease P protein component